MGRGNPLQVAVWSRPAYHDYHAHHHRACHPYFRPLRFALRVGGTLAELDDTTRQPAALRAANVKQLPGGLLIVEGPDGQYIELPAALPGYSLQSTLRRFLDAMLCQHYLVDDHPRVNASAAVDGRRGRKRARKGRGGNGA
jgi:hypothetical protein